MKNLAVHISFFWKEDRLSYLRKAIDGLHEIDDVDVFVHTNIAFEVAGATVVVHDLSSLHPYLLTWLSRSMMKSQLGQYEHYMYLEDDVLFNKKNFDYYKKWHEKCKRRNAYLGFLRVEQSTNGKWFAGDLLEKLSDKVDIDGQPFYKCNKYRYAAMWILDNEEMRKFVTTFSDLYEFKKLHYDGGISMSRENAAIGPIYEMFDDMLVFPCDGCFMHHLPNPAVNNPSSQFAKIAVEEIVNV